jgi:hypothetical protein
MIMSIKNNQGIKVIWSISAMILTILFIYLLNSISYMFTSQVVQLLQYLAILAGIISIMIMW